jgi:hypothetical protein
VRGEVTDSERGEIEIQSLLPYVRARRWLRFGILPASGGWLDQGARLVTALDVMLGEEALIGCRMRTS